MCSNQVCLISLILGEHNATIIDYGESKKYSVKLVHVLRVLIMWVLIIVGIPTNVGHSKIHHGNHISDSLFVCLFMYTASVIFDYYCRDRELSHIGGIGFQSTPPYISPLICNTALVWGYQEAGFF